MVLAATFGWVNHRYVWDGLRGGLAVALALVLRDHLPARQADVLLVMTYFVVVFSILVQAPSYEAAAEALRLRVPSEGIEEPQALGQGRR